MKGFIPKERIDALPESIRSRVDEGDPYWCSLPEGWRDLVIKLDEELKEVAPNYVLDQCKEKFGGLRYYISYEKDDDDKAAEDIIMKYENISEKTCDVCGAPGQNRVSNGWMATRCEEHN